MELNLSPVEVRVLGALIETEFTTPDSYPLSLNALTNACNQKTSREPVMNLSENLVLEAVETLARRGLVAQRAGSGSRVPKYAHRLDHRLREEENFSRAELAVLSILMLRGPQTAGELRIRTNRMHEFGSSHELEQTLKALAEERDAPCLLQLPRQPGQKETRYVHLLGGEIDPAQFAVAQTSTPVSDDAARILELENRVHSLEQELAALNEQLQAFVRQFD